MIHSVSFTTPDGVSRVLRLTHGAQKRISDNVGKPEDAPNIELIGLYGLKYVSNNLVELAYYLAFKEDGMPPDGLTLDHMREMYEPDNPELFGAVCEALSKGKKKQQEVQKMIQNLENVIQQSTGQKSGASPVSISESKARPRRRKSSLASSGTSRQTSSTPSLSVIPSANA